MKTKELQQNGTFEIKNKEEFASLLQRLFNENETFVVFEERYAISVVKTKSHFISTFYTNKREEYSLQTNHFQNFTENPEKFVNFKKHVNFLINNKKIKISENNPIILYLLK